MRGGALGLVLLGGCGSPLREPSELFGVWVVEDEAGEPVSARLLRAGQGGSETSFEEYAYDDLGARLVAGGAFGLTPGRGKRDGVRHLATLRFVYESFVDEGGVGAPYGRYTGWSSPERVLSFDGERLEVATDWTDRVVVHQLYPSVP